MTLYTSINTLKQRTDETSDTHKKKTKYNSTKVARISLKPNTTTYYNGTGTYSHELK